MTYADVARKLKLSETSIKRNFSQQNFNLERLEAICSMLGIDFTDLVRMADDNRSKISALKLEQEKELVADLKFLLVAICGQNAWQMNEITEYYDISETECIRYLIRLDRHSLIHLLSNNPIR